MYESSFPLLARDGYQIQSPQTLQYNCIAWAAGRDDRWWWPNKMSFWPDGVPESDKLDAFVLLFQKLGYETCDSSELEDDFEKVAIYVRDDRVQHAARQLENGRWTSKLGPQHDIEHSLDGLQGDEYGNVACIMRRPKQANPNQTS
jgi:hypothetical protein